MQHFECGIKLARSIASIKTNIRRVGLLLFFHVALTEGVTRISAAGVHS